MQIIDMNHEVVFPIHYIEKALSGILSTADAAQLLMTCRQVLLREDYMIEHLTNAMCYHPATIATNVFKDAA